MSSPGVDGIMPTLPCSPCSSPRQTQRWVSQSRNVGGGVFGALGSGVGQGAVVTLLRATRVHIPAVGQCCLLIGLLPVCGS